MSSIAISQWPQAIDAGRRRILEAALEAGVPCPHGCGTGECGGCKSMLLGGEATLDRYSPDALSDEERASGLILACRARPVGDVQVRWLARATPMPMSKLDAQVGSVDAVAHDVVVLTLTLPPGARFHFRPGQFVKLKFGKPPARSCSMANQPGDGRLVFHIRIVEHGKVSRHVAQALKPGDRVEVRGPFGSAFREGQDTVPLLLLAGAPGSRRACRCSTRFASSSRAAACRPNACTPTPSIPPSRKGRACRSASPAVAASTDRGGCDGPPRGARARMATWRPTCRPETPMSSPPQTAPTLVRGACPHDCPDTCALRITVQDGRAIKVQGDPDHPPTHGALCTKVSRYTERTYHADRVLYPMRRTGPKGSGKFERVGWDEALADIAKRLKAIAARDPQAILPYSYAGTMGLLQGESMDRRFFHRLGASLLDRTICSSAGGDALAATYGGKVGMHLEHFADSRLILIWGSNSIASNLHFWTFAQAAKRRGAKLVCIDPRKTETADKCHQHIALLPGTDGALALGLMHELIVNDWLDHDYIDRHTDGWPALRVRALQWPPERAAAVCGITADEVRGLARDYGTTTPAAIRLNYGMQRVHGGGNAVRLIAILPCLVGAWRQPAGGLLLSASGWFRGVTHPAALQRPELLAGRRPRTINMSTIGDDLLREASPAFGPKVEALVVYNSNPVAVAPESAQVVRGFERDDLFAVVLEHFMTDTADRADYVLPATTQLEHLDLHTSYGHTWALINEPAIAPLGEARPNTQIFRDLATAMGFDDPCFADDDEALARQAFQRDVDLEALRANGWVKLPLPAAPFADGGFPTPNGRCVIDAPGLGVPDHVPNHESVASRPDLAQRFPLAMISPPARNFLNSSFVNVDSLQAIEGEPLLEIHADDARPRGIESGATVRVFNDRGTYVCKAVVSARARPGVVNGLGVWWRKLGLNGTNVNQLTHQRLTDIGRAPSFYDCLVDVARLPT